jgi:hypothetical protein
MIVPRSEGERFQREDSRCIQKRWALFRHDE